MRILVATTRAVLVLSALVLGEGCGGPDCAAPEYGSCVRDSEYHGARDLAFLSWIEGQWRAEDPAGRVYDMRWAPATGGILLGFSQAHHGDRDLGATVLRVEFRRESITFVAHDGGEVPGTPYALTDRTRAEAGEARFENTEIEYPRRIIYRRDGDELIVRLENDDHGFTRVFRRAEDVADEEVATHDDAAAHGDAAADDATGDATNDD